MKKCVVVAMSGGVDSAVAALLLLEKGYKVIGATMLLSPNDSMLLEFKKERGCCSISSVNDAFLAAKKIGISHYVLNFREEFEDKVIGNFCSEYLAGRTPNPCVKCNEFIKFDLLLKKALLLGADYIATGHYARIRQDKNGLYQLLKGRDSVKDQSYFLHTITQEQMSHLLFPVGEFTKAQIREMAASNELVVAKKPESQEICFVANNDYANFVWKRSVQETIAPGPIYDKNGNMLGYHKGLPYYTVGQRKGLGISSSVPQYVIKIDKENNAIWVGEEVNLYQDTFYVENVNWVSILPPSSPRKAQIKIRSQFDPAPGTLFPDGEQATSKINKVPKNFKVKVVFSQLQKSITPGQSVVFYDDDTLLGGGIITLLL